jgi:hypothetical protein
MHGKGLVETMEKKFVDSGDLWIEMADFLADIGVFSDVLDSQLAVYHGNTFNGWRQFQAKETAIPEITMQKVR